LWTWPGDATWGAQGNPRTLFGKTQQCSHKTLNIGRLKELEILETQLLEAGHLGMFTTPPAQREKQLFCSVQPPFTEFKLSKKDAK